MVYYTFTYRSIMTTGTRTETSRLFPPGVPLPCGPMRVPEMTVAVLPLHIQQSLQDWCPGPTRYSERLLDSHSTIQNVGPDPWFG